MKFNGRLKPYVKSENLRENSRRKEEKMIYGYARVSTAKQDITRQIRNILAVCADAKIYSETFTGTKKQREDMNFRNF